LSGIVIIKIKITGIFLKNTIYYSISYKVGIQYVRGSDFKCYKQNKYVRCYFKSHYNTFIPFMEHFTKSHLAETALR